MADGCTICPARDTMFTRSASRSTRNLSRRRRPKADATADWRLALSKMTEAYRLGEYGRGEELLAVALDVGAPWDVATSAAAQALSARQAQTRGVSASVSASA